MSPFVKEVVGHLDWVQWRRAKRACTVLLAVVAVAFSAAFNAGLLAYAWDEGAAMTHLLTSAFCHAMHDQPQVLREMHCSQPPQQPPNPRHVRGS